MADSPNSASGNQRPVDLVARLRAFGDDTTLNDTERVLLWDAADEIERLREARGDHGGIR